MAHGTPGTWPAEVGYYTDGVQYGWTSNTLRTDLEDGLVRQEKTASGGLFFRTITAVMYSDAEFKIFKTFIEDHGDEFFNFPDQFDNPDAEIASSATPVYTQVRIRDGRAAVNPVCHQPQGAPRFYTAVLTLESVI